MKDQDEKRVLREPWAVRAMGRGRRWSYWGPALGHSTGLEGVLQSSLWRPVPAEEVPQESKAGRKRRTRPGSG